MTRSYPQRWRDGSGKKDMMHLLEIGLAQSKDNRVWEYAAQHGAAIVTKDEDFAEWVRRGRRGPAVVWLRIGNSSTQVLLTWFEPLLPRVIQKLQQGEKLIELR